MSFLKTIKPEDATGDVAAIYEPMMKAFGMVPAPLQLYSASPGLMSAVKGNMEYFKAHPTLSQGLLTLIRLVVAEEHKYNYCIRLNSDRLKMMGIADDDQLAAIMADTSKAPMEEKETAMLQVAVTACVRPEELQEKDIERLRELGWQDSDILDAICHGLMMVQGGILEKAVGLPDGAAC